MNLLPLPSWYDPAQVAQVYVERAGLIASEAKKWGANCGIKPAGQDRYRIASFGIDAQIGFATPNGPTASAPTGMPHVQLQSELGHVGGSLAVPGAVGDFQRAIEWHYRNMGAVTGLHFSMDTHRMFQVFHPAAWVDENSGHPAPLTVIGVDDVRSGKWRNLINPRAAIEYVQKLAATGKYVLTIWPYHTMLGGVSHALVPAVMEMSLAHAAARLRQTHFETKGTHPLTEMYSVLSPEVQELGGKSVGGFNTTFFRMLMDYDRVYIWGQAKSHCVLSTIGNLREHIENVDPTLMDKVYILEDAMSPVPPPPLSPLPPALDFPAVADAFIEDCRNAGMNVVRTTDDITV